MEPVPIDQPSKDQPSKPRKPNCEPISSYDNMTEILQRIAKSRKRPLFALVSDFLGVDVLKDVYSWKKELREIGKAGALDVLIHSPGGQLTACYMLARLLSRYTNDWEALVPEVAYSGATMICLGSSNIVMSEISQLGPVDPQVASKRREKFFATERQSPLEAFEAVKYLREFAVFISRCPHGSANGPWYCTTKSVGDVLDDVLCPGETHP